MKKPVIYGVVAVAFLVLTFLLWRNRNMMSTSVGVPVGEYSESMPMMVPSVETVKQPEMMERPYPTPGYEEGGMMGDQTFMMKSPGYYPTDIYPAYPSYQLSTSYSIVAKDPKQFSRTVRTFVTTVGGTVLNSNTSNTGRFLTSHITMTVPKAKLMEVTDRIAQEQGEIVTEDTYSNDRTGALDQAKAVVEELELQKAYKEAELAGLTSTTDRLRAQAALVRLERQIAQATQNVAIAQSELDLVLINISIANSKYYFSGEYTFSPGEQFAQAWYSFKQFAGGILNGFIWIAVYSLLIVPAGWFAWMALKSWRAAKKS